MTYTIHKAYIDFGSSSGGTTVTPTYTFGQFDRNTGVYYDGYAGASPFSVSTGGTVTFTSRALTWIGYSEHPREAVGWSAYAAEEWLMKNFKLDAVLVYRVADLSECADFVQVDGTGALFVDSAEEVIGVAVFPANSISGGLSHSSKAALNIGTLDVPPGCVAVGAFCEWDAARGLSGSQEILYNDRSDFKIWDISAGKFIDDANAGSGIVMLNGHIYG